jgi:thiamine biosynthesis protein ThiS
MTAEPIRVAINGEMREIRAKSVTGVVEELSLPAATVLIEHNGEALQRSEWPTRTVRDGDRFEILRVAAGG